MVQVKVMQALKLPLLYRGCVDFVLSEVRSYLGGAENDKIDIDLSGACSLEELINFLSRNYQVFPLQNTTPGTALFYNPKDKKIAELLKSGSKGVGFTWAEKGEEVDHCVFIKDVDETGRYEVLDINFPGVFKEGTTVSRSPEELDVILIVKKRLEKAIA